MGYFTELRTQWRPLTAALIGLGSGFSLTMFTTSIIAPHLLREFGWTRSEFALIGSLSLLTVAALPLVGRLTDVIGVRRTALIGIVTLPITFIGFGAMTGDIRQYIALFLAQALLCVTTTSTVYSRVVVQYVRNARGLALAIAASGPALTGAIGGPMLNMVVENYGWRAGYHALAVFSVIAGILTLLLLPPEQPKAAAIDRPKARRAKEDYATIVRNSAFWVLVVALLMCNLPQVIALTQLKLVLLENGVTAAGASVMISAFAIGVIAGRFATGVALDQFPAHIVAAIGMGLPSIGLFLIASSLDSTAVLTLAVLLIGLSFGAEGDVVGFLVVRRFGVSLYSSVLGLMTAAISISTSCGAALVSLMLKLTGGYSLFLWTTGLTVLFGSLLFLLLGRSEVTVPAMEPA